MYDYSGLNWVPIPATASGVRIPRVTNSGDSCVTSVSGNIVSVSGSVTTITSVSGNFVSISGYYFTSVVESGLGAVSGVMGPAGLMAWDLSGLKWNPLAVGNSGANTLNVAATVNATANISGQAVFLGSGSTLGLSGLFSQVYVSGLWASTTLTSGQFGVSGGLGSLGFAYDFSGLKWTPMATSTSGVSTLHVTASGDSFVTSVSGNVVSISGTATVTGAVSVSGNTVLPQTPTFIKSNDNTRFSVASGGTALTSITCVACTIRNIGNSGDVILVGSLSSPPYFGTSGQAWPAVSGMGLWLRDGDAVTINTNSTGNIKITANLSGTPVSYIAIG